MIRFGIAKLEPGLRPLESGRLLRALRDQAQASPSYLQFKPLVGSSRDSGCCEHHRWKVYRQVDLEIFKVSKFGRFSSFSVFLRQQVAYRIQELPTSAGGDLLGFLRAERNRQLLLELGKGKAHPRAAASGCQPPGSAEGQIFLGSELNI